MNFYIVIVFYSVVGKFFGDMVRFKVIFFKVTLFFGKFNINFIVVILILNLIFLKIRILKKVVFIRIKFN